MRDLKQKTFECLSRSLSEIFASSRTLLAESEIRNLNIGLCLLQCGLSSHPLVPAMILGKKKYFAYWSNDEVMEQMLEAWLKSEMLLALSDISGYESIYRDLKDAISNYLEPMRMASDEEEPPSFNPYTLIMVGHLARNMHLVKPGDPLAKSYFTFTYKQIVRFALVQLQNRQFQLLDFCISYFSGIESLMSREEKEVRQAIVEMHHHILEQDEFWNIKDDDMVAHLLMDLHIGNVLPKQYYTKGVLNLIVRIDKVLGNEKINLQTLTRLTRSLGELARDWHDIPAMLNRQVTSVYSENILDEIHRVVLDERGVTKPEITRIVDRVRKERKLWNEGYLKDILECPYENSSFKVRLDLEFIDIVKPPDDTLRDGGDCDNLAALYAAMLLAAGHEKVYLFHLYKEWKEDDTLVIQHHAVACLPKPDTENKVFFCFDPQIHRIGQPVPELHIKNDGKVDLIGSKNRINACEIYSEKILDTQDYIIEHVKNNVTVRATVRGFTFRSVSDYSDLNLKKNVPNWILLYTNDHGGTSSRLKDFMINNMAERKDSYEDIVAEYNQPVFDRYKELFQLGIDTINYPALIIFFSREWSGIQDGDNPGEDFKIMVLDYDMLHNMESKYAFSGMIVELQKYSEMIKNRFIEKN